MDLFQIDLNQNNNDSFLNSNIFRYYTYKSFSLVNEILLEVNFMMIFVIIKNDVIDSFLKMEVNLFIKHVFRITMRFALIIEVAIKALLL